MPNVYFGLLTAVTLLVAVIIEFSLTPVLLGWRLKADERAPLATKVPAAGA
jgi:hypothetical protein